MFQIKRLRLRDTKYLARSHPAGKQQLTFKPRCALLLSPVDPKGTRLSPETVGSEGRLNEVLSLGAAERWPPSQSPAQPASGCKSFLPFKIKVCSGGPCREAQLEDGRDPAVRT